MSKSKQLLHNEEAMSKFYINLLCAIDTSFALKAALLYRYGEWEQLLCLEVDVLGAVSSDRLFLDQQVKALFYKNPSIPTKVDLKAIAVGKFLTSENHCYEYNRSFKPMQSNNLELNGVLHTAQRFVRGILKRLNPSCNLRFGKGATTACRGIRANLVSKLGTLPDVTVHSEPFVKELIAMNPLYRESLDGWNPDLGPCVPLPKLNKVRGNKFSCVPKDARSHRGICTEPCGNMMLQLEIGSLIRKRLRKAGYDLDNMQKLHGILARDGSVDGGLATIDLSNASDNISIAVVKYLLPPDWFHYLNMIRSHYTNVDGTWVKLEKFASMGNGFIFELESLIFLSLAYAVSACHGDLKSDIVSSYGDDIIIPCYLSAQLFDTLKYCGFQVNHEKSFFTKSSLFRESCGQDFRNGYPVRPVYIKELPENEILRWYSLANKVRQIAKRRFNNGFCDSSFAGTWKYCVRQIPTNSRFFGPECFGDSVIIATRDEFVGYSVYKNGMIRVTQIDKVVRTKVRPNSNQQGHAMACALFGVPSTGVARRNAEYTLKKNYTYPVNWDNLENAWI